MIDIVKRFLLAFSCIDVLMQLFVQMPFVYNNRYEKAFGIRKIWLHPLNGTNFNQEEVNFGFDYAINKGNGKLFEGLTLDKHNLYM